MPSHLECGLGRLSPLWIGRVLMARSERATGSHVQVWDINALESVGTLVRVTIHQK